MRLEHLCDLELTYQSDFVLVRPYGTEEGGAFGSGDGRADGEGLKGTLQWVNHPRRRSDGAMQPDVHGLLLTPDGAQVLFSLQGRTVWLQTPEGRQGRQLLRALFEAEAEGYRWLNETVCIAEGKYNSQTGTSEIHVYQCLSDLL